MTNESPILEELRKAFNGEPNHLQMEEAGDSCIFWQADGHICVRYTQLNNPDLLIFTPSMEWWAKDLMLRPLVEEMVVMTGIYQSRTLQGAASEATRQAPQTPTAREFLLCPPHEATHFLIQATYSPLEVPADNAQRAYEFGYRLQATETYVLPTSTSIGYYAWIVPIAGKGLEQKRRELAALYQGCYDREAAMHELNPLVRVKVHELMEQQYQQRVEKLEGACGELTPDGFRLTVQNGLLPETEYYDYTIDGLLDLIERLAVFRELGE